MNVRDALRHGAAVLDAAGVPSARLDARLLLGHATGLDQAALLREPGSSIDPGAYQALLDRRTAREPVALIRGIQEFWSLPFAVSAATLIPRPDSETIVEAALAAAPGARRVLDLGTGTGCLLLAVLSERPGAWGLGIDLAPDAAALARRNAAALGMADRTAMLCASWTDAIRGRFNLVLSNPPYIRTDELEDLMADVRVYEPTRALDGGADGLHAYRTVLALLPSVLEPGGVAVLELGAGQALAVRDLARAAGFRRMDVRTDLSGMARALIVQG